MLYRLTARGPLSCSLSWRSYVEFAECAKCKNFLDCTIRGLFGISIAFQDCLLCRSFLAIMISTHRRQQDKATTTEVG